MKSTTLLCLPLLLWQLVAGQIYPHLSFMLFSNHSYIDLSLIGENDDNNILQCSTDLITCCSSTQGDYRGDWYYPNGEKLQFSSGGADIYQRRDDRVVKLLRRNGDVSPTGIYRCEIPTTAVHNDSNGNTLRDVLYVGLYTSGGDLAIQENVGFTLSSDFNENTLHFTFTCVSTDGPATMVTWTRDNVIITDGTETVLNDPETSQYTHTLTVTGNVGGLYTCTVANNKPSLVNSSITVSVGGLVLSASGATATSISISWTSEAAGGSEVVTYEVIWQRNITVGCAKNDEGSATITDGSTSYDITGLEEDSNYTITVTASNSSGRRIDLSNNIIAMTLEAAPSAAPSFLEATYVNSSTIIISWGPLQRCRDNNGDISGYLIDYGSEPVSVTGDSSGGMYAITGLAPYTNYPIKVAAVNNAGTGPYSTTIHIPTHDVGVPYLSVDYDNIQATSIPISWSDADIGNGVNRYEVVWQTDDVGGCSGGSDVGTEFILNDETTSYVIMGLKENSRYNITVTAHGTLYFNTDTITVMTLEAEPTGPPTDVTLSATASNITVQWNEVECIHRNGNITGYTISYTNTQNETVTGSEALSVVLTDLLPSTSYTVKVAAINSVGIGIYSEAMIIETSQDFQISMSGFIVCTEWETYSTNETVQEITNTLISELNVRCQCQIMTENIKEARMSCHEELSNTVIYEASLSRTSQANTSEIIEHLNSWVASSPIIRVRGVSMSIGQKCTISTIDFSDACNSSAISATCEPDMIGTEIVVGVALGVAVATTLLVVMATLIFCAIRYKKQHLRSYSMKPYDGLDSTHSTHFDGTTLPNMAYNMTTLTRERRSSSTNDYDVISNPHTTMIDTQNMTSSITRERSNSSNSYDVIPNPHTAIDTYLPPVNPDRPQLPLPPAISDGSYEVHTPENIKRLRQQATQENNETDGLYSKVIDNT